MRNEIRVDIHSMVDVITNSSTVIYTWATGGTNQVKELINAILKASGSDKTSDDLFTIEERMTEDGMERVLDKMDESSEFEDRIDELEKTFPEGWGDLPYGDKAMYRKQVSDLLTKIFYSMSENDREHLCVDSEYEIPFESSVYIKSKNDTMEEIDMLRVFESIFGQWATRDG